MAKFLDLTGLGSFKEKIQTWATGLFVQKESGKGLSTNDYTTAEKNKLSGLEPLTIKVVKVNGTALTPDASKAVNVDLSTYALKTAVTQEIAQAVSGIKGFEAQVVASLPTTGASGILYLVSNSGTGQNVYDEFLWVNGKYETLGSRELDLSAYAKKTDIPTKTSQLTNDSGFMTSVPSEYVTETELTAKGYQTASQVGTAIDGKLVGYAKTSDLPTAITNAEIDALFTS